MFIPGVKLRQIALNLMYTEHLPIRDVIEVPLFAKVFYWAVKVNKLTHIIKCLTLFLTQLMHLFKWTL